jgi:hypothetical protein
MKKSEEIITIITAITGERVIVRKDEMEHAMRHFLLPEEIFLELLEKVLKNPSEIYFDESSEGKTYHLFYRLFQKKYILAVVKVISEGAYFASMYATGETIRKSHKKFKRLRL